MKSKSIWLIVADEGIARFLRWHGRGTELEPIEELTDPAAHARGAELRRDAHGRRGSGAARGGLQPAGATASAGADDEHLEAESFARSVAQRLTEHLHAKRFDELKVAAAPRFLGLLRKALTPQVTERVSGTVDKDLVHLGNRELAERMFEDRALARSR